MTDPKNSSYGDLSNLAAKQHDLRNKLAIITGSVDIILVTDHVHDQDMLDDLQRIRKAACDALAIIDELGDLYSISNPIDVATPLVVRP